MANSVFGSERTVLMPPLEPAEYPDDTRKAVQASLRDMARECGLTAHFTREADVVTLKNGKTALVEHTRYSAARLWLYGFHAGLQVAGERAAAVLR